jgi:hypothetical protein
LAVVVQHWFVLLSCWDDPHRSLTALALTGILPPLSYTDPVETGVRPGAGKLCGRTHPIADGVYLLYRLLEDDSTKSYGGS